MIRRGSTTPGEVTKVTATVSSMVGPVTVDAGIQPDAPGRQAPVDCNQDGGLDISDGICLLGFLFVGSPSTLPCGDGRVSDPANETLFDGNGDGNVDVSDVVSVFQFLFLGGQPPVACTDTGCGACILVSQCPDVCSP